MKGAVIQLENCIGQRLCRPPQETPFGSQNAHAVKRVTVRIQNPDATLVEAGTAMQQAGGFEWGHTATAANASLPGAAFHRNPYDRPGNQTTIEHTR